MSDSVITHPEEATPARLTRVLRASGALKAGRVLGVVQDADTSSWSSNVRLRLTYDADATGLCPPALFLKICAGEHGVFGPSEVEYYTRDYVDLVDAPLPRCHDAVYQASPRAYHLLLDDLSGTHSASFERAPTLERGCRTAEALARLHAHRWGGDGLAAAGLGIVEPEALAGYAAHNEPGFGPIRAALGAGLDPAWAHVLDEVQEHHHAAMLRRREDPSGHTLVHGDLNPGNVLAPTAGMGPVYLIDRQPFDWSLTVWVGASDLARLMVLYWPVEARKQWQFLVLRQYQTALSQEGIDYPWDLLVEDYRLSIIQCVVASVEWGVIPDDVVGKRWVWELHLGRSMAAYAEFNCDECLCP